MQQKAHYVDNQKFLAALIDYKTKCDDAQAAGNERPILPNYIGECFIKIANHLAYKSNFINYSFRDDMVSDAIENCLVAAQKFDPNISSNPFAYYTQIIYFAFIRRIQKEKKQQATKYKMLETLDLDEIVSQEEDLGDFGTQFLESIRRQVDNVDYERKTISNSKKSTKLAEEISNQLDFDE